MRNIIKLCVSTIKYGGKVKLLLGISIITFLLAHLTLLLDIGHEHMGVGLWIAGLMLLSGATSLNATQMVLSSPRRRILQTMIPVMMSLIIDLAAYVWFLLVELIFWFIDGYQPQPGIFIFVGTVCGIYTLYTMAFLKLFPLTAGFCGVAFVLVLDVAKAIYPALEGLSVGAAVGIGLAEILVSGIMLYGLLRLTYRLPIDKRALGQQLRKYM